MLSFCIRDRSIIFGKETPNLQHWKEGLGEAILKEFVFQRGSLQYFSCKINISKIADERGAGGGGGSDPFSPSPRSALEYNAR